MSLTVLFTIGILGMFSWVKIIRHFNYELNFKESLLFPISTLILAILGLHSYALSPLNSSELSLIVIVYFLILLILYYIIRSIKLKKYIPLRCILRYILIAILNYAILFIAFLSNLVGTQYAFGLILIYPVICIAYIGILLLLNTSLFSVNYNNKNNVIYDSLLYKKNIDYDASKLGFKGLLVIALLIALIYGFLYFNEYCENKLIESKKDFVIEYLTKEYPNYEFSIREGRLDTETSLISYKIDVSEFNEWFYISINPKNSSIHEEEFKEIFDKAQRNLK